MAGESPDRSEQGKSSGETTRGERDPRPAVLGRAGSADVDQPTAVFRLPGEPERQTAGGGARGAAEGRSEALAARSPEPGTETGSMENDKRLRSAVAAWVASADDEPEGSSDEDSSEGPSEGPSEKSPRNEDAPKPADETAALPQASAEETALLPGVRKPMEDDAGSVEADGDDEAGASGEGRDGASGAKAAPVTKAPEASKSAAPEPETVESETVTAGAGASKSGPAGRKPVEPKAVEPKRQEEPADSESAADPKGPKTPESSKTAEKPEAPADSADSADSESPEKPGQGKLPAAGASAPAKPVPASEPKPGSSASGPVKPEAPKPGSAELKSEPKPEPSKPGSPKGKSEPEVDQPTAVFAAVRTSKSASKPATGPDSDSDSADDSPTTALKIPPPPRRESTPGAAERPSTFVPLRKDDDVRTPSWSRNDTAEEKAEAGAGAKTAAKPGEKAEGKPADKADRGAKDGKADGPSSEAGSEAAGAAAASAAGPGALFEAERTRQQALPPQPPLDLLAQLTNTPETPARSALRRVKIWTPLLLLLVVALGVVQVVRPLPAPTLTLSGDPTYTFEGGELKLPFPNDGQGAVAVDGVGTVAVYGEQKVAPIASVTKAMTAYVILRENPLKGKQTGDKITIDARTEKEYQKGLNIESVLPVKEGQQYTQRQMLEMLMVESANNVGRLLARWDAGSEKEFVAKMNAAAEELGMKDTVYTDPSGLRKTTVSTPQDQLKLATAAMRNKVFAEIVNTTQVFMPGLDRMLYNTNGRALLKDGVGGIKTGSSTPAGGNLLWAANASVDGEIHRVLGVTMGVQKAKELPEKLQLAITHSIRVLQSAQKAVTSATVVRKGDVVGRVEDGLGGSVPVVAAKDLKAIGWAGHKVEITIDDDGKAVPGTGAAGDVVGRISVGTGAARVTAPVELQRDLLEPGFTERLTRLR